MSSLRVIAVEIYDDFIFDQQAIISCVYKDGQFLVYDTFGQLYHQKEYFTDFSSLDYWVQKGCYEWTDFSIPTGQLVFRDTEGSILVDRKKVKSFNPLIDEIGDVSNVSLKIFHEFLKSINRNYPDNYSDILRSYKSGDFQKEIRQIISENYLEELLPIDKEIIIKSRILGREYLIDYVRKLLSSDDDMKIHKITFFFTRLFKLEASNYIKIK